MRNILLIFIFCILLGQSAYCDFTIDPDWLEDDVGAAGEIAQKWPVPCNFFYHPDDKPDTHRTFRYPRCFEFDCYLPKKTKKAIIILKTPNGRYEFAPHLNKSGWEYHENYDIFCPHVGLPDSFGLKMGEVANMDLTLSVEAKIGKKEVVCSFPVRISSKRAFDNGLAHDYDLLDIPVYLRKYPIPVRRPLFYTEYEIKIGLMSYHLKKQH
jgi:hypothetical protein